MSPKWKKGTIDTTAGAEYLTEIERQVIIGINMVRTDPAEYALRYMVPLRSYYHFSSTVQAGLIFVTS